MLYITRKIGESIIIDDDIELKIIDVTGKTVRLGFESPDDTTILRKELYQKIQEENIKASNSEDEVKKKLVLEKTKVDE